MGNRGQTPKFGKLFATCISNMRHSRRSILPGKGASIHTIWRFHNRSFELKPDPIKRLFLKCMLFALKHRATQDQIKLSAYCIMDNHAHQILNYTRQPLGLSKFLQISLTRFARLFNDTQKRTGAVGNGRAKTIPIQGTPSAKMRAHMYVEANPIRARIRKFENLKMFEFSSFRFYAFGITDEFTVNLAVPEWYLHLGTTAQARQRRYRSLFKGYLEGDHSTRWPDMRIASFFGELSWASEQLRNLRKPLARTENQISPISLPPPS